MNLGCLLLQADVATPATKSWKCNENSKRMENVMNLSCLLLQADVPTPAIDTVRKGLKDDVNGTWTRG